MSMMDEREKAMEKQFQLSKEKEFQATMKANKQFGIWLAEMMKVEPAGVVEQIIDADLEEKGHQDILKKAQELLMAQKIEVSDNELEKKLLFLRQEARKELSEQ